METKFQKQTTKLLNAIRNYNATFGGDNAANGYYMRNRLRSMIRIYSSDLLSDGNKVILEVRNNRYVSCKINDVNYTI